MSANKQYDCVISGAGMVGGATALALAELGLKVAIVDRQLATPVKADEPYDLRVSAISLASQQLLKQLDIWQYIDKTRMAEYARLGVWEKEFAYTEFNATDINQPYLGHIVENRLIQLALWQSIENHPNITLFCPNSIENIHHENDFVRVELTNQTIQCRLLVGADGANSNIRQLAGIGITGWDYNQSAMLINVETSLEQQDITWQKFTATGPVAMLPLAGKSELGGYASLVWYGTRDEISRLSTLDNDLLGQHISAHFPERLGDIKVLAKGAFPLTRRHANSYYQSGIVLLGDAAHTINPMAGQGVNIGFKDVAALQQVIASAIGSGEVWYQNDTLKKYEQARRKHNLLMMSMMDALYVGFSHPSGVVQQLRNAALFTTNKLPWAKNKVLAYACGV